MAVVCLFAVHLTGSGRQQVLQGPKAVLNPVAPLPCPDEPRPANVSLQTEQVVQLHTELVDVLPGLKAGASTPPDGSAVAPVRPRPFLPALNGGVPRAFLMVDAAQEFAQLQLRFVDQLQQRYEVIRP